MNVLIWDRPPQARPSAEHLSVTADGAPPGVYVPNMPESWMHAWKARLLGVVRGPLRVEVRKTTGNGVQLVVKIGEDGNVLMSMNGTADMGVDGVRELLDAVTESLDVMAGQRARKEAAHAR